MCEPRESPAERLWIISHLLRPGWLMLTSPSFPGWARSLEVCGSVEEAGLTNHGRGREELRLKRGGAWDEGRRDIMEQWKIPKRDRRMPLLFLSSSSLLVARLAFLLRPLGTTVRVS